MNRMVSAPSVPMPRSRALSPRADLFRTQAVEIRHLTAEQHRERQIAEEQKRAAFRGMAENIETA